MKKYRFRTLKEIKDFLGFSLTYILKSIQDGRIKVIYQFPKIKRRYRIYEIELPENFKRNEWLTRDEIDKIYNISGETLRSWKNKKIIETIKLGEKTFLYRKVDIPTFLRKGKKLKVSTLK